MKGDHLHDILVDAGRLQQTTIITERFGQRIGKKKQPSNLDPIMLPRTFLYNSVSKLLKASYTNTVNVEEKGMNPRHLCIVCFVLSIIVATAGQIVTHGCGPFMI
jgi:hypothetical protein